MNRWVLAALTLATLLAYAPALSAPFVMDDASAIAETRSVVGGPPAGSPVAGRPVAGATLSLNYAVNMALGVDQRPDPDGPRKAVGFRLLNVLFHLCTGALLFGVLRRAMRERKVPEDWRAAADPLAAAVCALWLLHPIQSEAINYVVQRTELLASLFYVATLYASIRAWDAASRGVRVRWYAVAIVACLLGMSSKEIVISAPLAVVLYDRAFRLESWSAISAPGDGRGWFYIALAVVCATSYAFIAAHGRGNTAGFASPLAWYVYFYSQCWAIAHYLRLVVWPRPLAIDYGDQPVTGSRGVPGLIALAVFAVATLTAWIRAERWAWFAFAGAWFFMLLAPSSSIVPVSTEIAAERRIYLGLAAVLLLVVVGAEWLRRRYWSSVSTRRLCYGFGAVAALLAVVTGARSAVYASPEALWRGDVEAVPGNARGYVNLGSALMREHPPKSVEGEAAFRKAIALDTTCANGCAELAYFLNAQGRRPEAEALLERTVADHPRDVISERRLSLIQMKMGSFDLAVPHIAHIAADYPTEQDLVVLAAASLAVRHQRDGIAALQNAMERYPQNAEIRELGETLFTAGRSADALPHLEELAVTLASSWQ